MPRPPLPPGLTWYTFLEAESTPGHMELSDATEKNPQRQRESIPGPSNLQRSALSNTLPQAPDPLNRHIILLVAEISPCYL
jgi:hypothetical protein